jgi:transcriptional regulator
MKDITIRFIEFYNYLINEKKVASASDFCKKIGISTSTLTEIIKGRSDVGIVPVQNSVCFYNELSADWLLRGQGEMLKKDSTESSSEQYEMLLKNNVPQVVVVGDDELGDERIALVPIKAQAGYLTGYDDPVYIETLPTFNLPNMRNGSYRMFEIKGLSMFPTLEDGDFVVGQYVDNLENMTDNRVYVVVTREDGIIVKRCVNRLFDKRKKFLLCKSDNRSSEYTNIKISPFDIKEIWECKMRLSHNFFDPVPLYERITNVETDIEVLKETNAKLKKQIAQLQEAKQLPA